MAAAFALVLALVAAWTAVTPSKYESVASVVLRTNNNQQLFPSVGSSQRSQFIRQPLAELEYTRATVFAREANLLTPPGSSVTARYDEGDRSRSSELRFVAVAGDPTTSQAAAKAWADYYLQARSDVDVDEVSATITSLEAQIATLELEKDALLLPIKPIDDALLAETNSDAISRLTTQRLSLRQSLEDDLLPISLQLRTLSQDLSNLRIAAGYVGRADNSARMSVEAAPGRKVAPLPARNFMLGSALGFMIAAAAALVRESFRATINGAEDLEAIAPGIPILARVPAFPKGNDNPRALAAEAGSTYAQSLERIVSSLLYRQALAGGERSSVLFTSAIPGEGKTTVVSHLAERIGKTETSCIVIDADLRRPDMHLSLGMKQRVPGLSHLLVARQSLAPHLVPMKSAPHVRVLTAGAATDDAASLLRQSFTAALDSLPTDHELLLVDAPPVLAVTDAEIMSRSVDGVVIVVRPGKTKRGQVAETVQKLTAAQATILGFVVVAAETSAGAYAETYYYYQTDADTASLRNYVPEAASVNSQQQLQEATRKTLRAPANTATTEAKKQPKTQPAKPEPTSQHVQPPAPAQGKAAPKRSATMTPPQPVVPEPADAPRVVLASLGAPEESGAGAFARRSPEPKHEPKRTAEPADVLPRTRTQASPEFDVGARKSERPPPKRSRRQVAWADPIEVRDI